MYKNNYKKPLTKKGYIEDIKISDVIKNDYVGQSDYYLHSIIIKNENNETEEFIMRQMTTEIKFEVGTHVTFRYNNNKDFDKPLIEAKSFGQSLSPKELDVINNKIEDKIVSEKHIFSSKNKSLRF